MNEQQPIEQLSERIRAFLANTPAADLERNIRVLLGGFFSRLDLVSREEFDVQAKVLARTREKLALLEARLAELERRKPD